MSGSEISKVAAEGSLSHTRPERASLVELKNGKIVFKQKTISFEKHSETLQDIVKFRHMLQARIDQQVPPLDSIPEEHRPLIAKLGHESDKSLASLSKHVMQQLLPTEDEDEDDGSTPTPTSTALPLTVVEGCIKLILTRNNYGLDAINGAKPPAAVCIWRWEVKECLRDWLPKNAREKAELRLAERLQAKQDLKVIFDALSKEDQEALFGHKHSGKTPVNQANKQQNSVVGDQVTANEDARSPTARKPPKQISGDVENESHLETSPEKSEKGQKDPKRVVKEKERLQKKAAKAEKEKKEKDAQLKSRSVMANFLSKPRLNSRAASKEFESPIAGPSKLKRDFDKHFKPFVLRKDTTLAPTNWFHEIEKEEKKISREVITIDIEEDRPSVEDVEMQNPHATEDFSGLNAQERLQSVLFSLPPSPGSLRMRPCQNSFRTNYPANVRDMVTQLSEAEISGDTSMVRKVLAKLRDRALLPAKVFIFHEDARPGYFGTWTRNSRVVKPRTPFAKDLLVFDYSYDSGEEWEEEAVGDADDVVDEGEDEDIGDEEADSDLDSWLVDDDDEPEVVPDDRDLTPPAFEFPVHLPPKRKAEDGEKKMGKRRKVVVPLVPFAKGPCWEMTVGHVEYNPFKSYRIQLFNDTPFPIDPFSFVSTCMEKRASERRNKNGGSTAHTTDFAVPSLPERLANSTPTHIPLAPTTSTVASKRAAIIKSTFPDIHTPFLLQKINELQAPSIILLVEAIYQGLRVHKVKKNAIEAKVREVSEKCKEQRFWIVKKHPTTVVDKS